MVMFSGGARPPLSKSWGRLGPPGPPCSYSPGFLSSTSRKSHDESFSNQHTQTNVHVQRLNVHVHNIGNAWASSKRSWDCPVKARIRTLRGTVPIRTFRITYPLINQFLSPLCFIDSAEDLTWFTCSVSLPRCHF